MRFYRKCMAFIKRCLQDDEGISEADKAYLDRIPKQNGFGLVAMFNNVSQTSDSLSTILMVGSIKGHQ